MDEVRSSPCHELRAAAGPRLALACHAIFGPVARLDRSIRTTRRDLPLRDASRAAICAVARVSTPYRIAGRSGPRPTSSASTVRPDGAHARPRRCSPVASAEPACDRGRRLPTRLRRRPAQPSRVAARLCRVMARAWATSVPSGRTSTPFELCVPTSIADEEISQPESTYRCGPRGPSPRNIAAFARVPRSRSRHRSRTQGRID